MAPKKLRFGPGDLLALKLKQTDMDEFGTFLNQLKAAGVDMSDWLRELIREHIKHQTSPALPSSINPQQLAALVGNLILKATGSDQVLSLTPAEAQAVVEVADQIDHHSEVVATVRAGLGKFDDLDD